MHRLHSKSMIWRFRLASLLLCANCLLVPISAFLLLHSVIDQDQELSHYGLAIMVTAIVFGILQWIITRRTNCPLCITPVLAAKHCAKHRKARSLLGSFRLRVALAVIFKNSFTCPYCNEATLLQVRTRRRN